MCQLHPYNTESCSDRSVVVPMPAVVVPMPAVVAPMLAVVAPMPAVGNRVHIRLG